MARSIEHSHCYLCGEPLSGVVNRDHVPPDSFLARSLRKKERIKLITFPVHEPCNTSYKLDEEYFVQTLVPFAKGSFAGDAVFKKAVSDFHAGKNRPLVAKVLSQAADRVGAVLLPPGRVAIQLDGPRFERVITKLVRGLCYADSRVILPRELELFWTLTPPNETPPEHFLWFMNNVSTESRGNHQGVFAYRNHNEGPYQYWAMLLWDRVIITAFCSLPSASDSTSAAS